ncbi:MAG: hypothetical protein AAGA20_17725 [Planctomycetota bacterium]
MIRDLTFDQLERAAFRRRLVRIVLACTALSTVLTVGVIREVRIYDAIESVPPALAGDLSSLEARHDAIEGLLDKHHFWTGAFQARGELADLVVAIHEEQRALEAVQLERSSELKRIREEAESARERGLASVENGDLNGGLMHFERALQLADTIGPEGFGGAVWEHREQLVVDIAAIESEQGLER